LLRRLKRKLRPSFPGWIFIDRMGASPSPRAWSEPPAWAACATAALLGQFLISVSSARPKADCKHRTRRQQKSPPSQWIMSSVLNPRSHELWREAAQRDQTGPGRQREVRSLGPKGPPLLGVLGPEPERLLA
jgi:hypothetical protein